MIIQPDFLDHWKTQLLIEILEDKCAPLYVIRLWAHCQNRKTHRFPRVNPAITKAICKAPQKADIFESAMIEAGFIVIEDGDIIAHEWDVVNAYLINSWNNGKKGGRPSKKTQNKPTGNPKQTQTEPIREEKIGEDKSRVKKKGSRFAPPTPEELKEYVSEYSVKSGKQEIDCQHFINFYESKGWMVGKNKMKDWKASARTWFKDQPEIKQATSGPGGTFL